jgi:RimJ/RimL family protein N-acetyltransferase
MPGSDIELMQLTREELFGLSGAAPVRNFAGAPEGALPPPHVADRALRQLEAGVPAFWCVPFLIIARPEGAILGGCTFKGAPLNGDVEIAYGVAAQARGRGVATAAVSQLLKLAAANGSVRQVIAEVLPSNLGSSKVVSRLGFTERETFVDTDGETVIRWALRLD